MKRAVSGIAVIALVLGALVGFVGSLPWSRARQDALNDARESTARLERRLNALRAENDRMAAQLKAEHARAQTIAGDLRREREMNMRLHLIVSDGKK